MSNRTDPPCREAFIEAMEASDLGYNTFFYPAGISGEEPDWQDDSTCGVFRGYAMLWTPPRDVDPATLLGKLKAAYNIGLRTYGVEVEGTIELIESLQREVAKHGDALFYEKTRVGRKGES